MSYNNNYYNQGYQQNGNYTPQSNHPQPMNSQPMNSQPMHLQNQNQMTQNKQFQNAMPLIQSQESIQNFIKTNLHDLTEDNYDAQTFVQALVDDAFKACDIFIKKKQQIEHIIQGLKAFKSRQNNDPFKENAFQAEINLIQEDTNKIIIEKRINEMKDVDNFIELAKSFEEKNFKLISQIKQTLDNNGVLNLDPQEYLQWLEIIKESQLKLNIITGYSNIIYNTQANIDQFEKIINPEVILQRLQQFEEEQIHHIKSFKNIF